MRRFDAGRAVGWSIPIRLKEGDMKFEAEARELPEKFVACVRNVGPYTEIPKAMEAVFAWAGPKGLIGFPKTERIAVYHDDPKKVDASELRSDACLTVPEGTEGEGDVKTMRIPGGWFAVARVEVDPSEFGDAWDKLLGEWMPESGYESDNDRMCYELYLNDHTQHPEGKFILDICEPVLAN
jgi:AraC family transcriptional regulator